MSDTSRSGGLVLLKRRLALLRRLIEGCPKHEVAVHADEADIHPNPKIGLDWMSIPRESEQGS